MKTTKRRIDRVVDKARRNGGRCVSKGVGGETGRHIAAGSGRHGKEGPGRKQQLENQQLDPRLKAWVERRGGKILGRKTWFITAHFVFGRKPAPGYVIDHINGNPTDCRRANLQEITQSANVMKGLRRCTVTEKYRNVYQRTETRRGFEASVRLQRRTIFTGRGRDPEALARQVDKVLRAQRIRGMRYNFPRKGEYGLDGKKR